MTWDAFSSYSSLDDELHRGWIKDFTIERRRVHLLLQQEGYTFGLDEMEFFRDKESMPANGSVEDELIKNVKTSGFLLLFIGDNYLKSQWCGKELDWFSARFSGIPKEALKNMFMIMLTPTAVRNASKDFSKGNLQKIKANGIFQLAYASALETPIEPQFPDEYGTLRTNLNTPGWSNKIAKTLADRFVEAGVTVGGPPPPPPQPAAASVVFGVVNRSLRDYRSTLAARVEAKLNTKVDCWDWEDLGLTRNRLNARLGQAKLFIQLVDIPPIGILGGSTTRRVPAAQRDWFRENDVAVDRSADGTKPGQEEHNPDHPGFLATCCPDAQPLGGRHRAGNRPSD